MFLYVDLKGNRFHHDKLLERRRHTQSRRVTFEPRKPKSGGKRFCQSPLCVSHQCVSPLIHPLLVFPNHGSSSPLPRYRHFQPLTLSINRQNPVFGEDAVVMFPDCHSSFSGTVGVHMGVHPRRCLPFLAYANCSGCKSIACSNACLLVHLGVVSERRSGSGLFKSSCATS